MKDSNSDLAVMKRFLERWTADPVLREADTLRWQEAYADLGVKLPDEVVEYFRRYAETPVIRNLAPKKPELVQKYEQYYAGKFGSYRSTVRKATNFRPAFRAWRQNQIDRADRVFGGDFSDHLAHVPCAIELGVGCSVGCWFCSVDAPKLERQFRATPENIRFWQGMLRTLAEHLGFDVQHAFLYWATDPLDNPEYEILCSEFSKTLGRFPSTTTALAAKDCQRTRRLLELSRKHGTSLNRFSVLSLKQLSTIHQQFAPEELLDVEVIPQNSGSILPKSLAGRAREHEGRLNVNAPRTNACVSGLLINLIGRTTKLIHPCNASDEHPLGYKTIQEFSYSDLDDFTRGIARTVGELGSERNAQCVR